MHPHRRRKKRPNYGIRTVEVGRGQNGFGFTISGQQPCILSCIVANSPADNAGLRAGDFLISVNGLSVSKLPHDSVVQLIGNSVGIIRMSIAENYYSDSSDDEILGSRIGLNHRSRPRYPHKMRVNRFNRMDPHKTEVESFKFGKQTMKEDIIENSSHNVILSSNACNNDISNVSAMVCREQQRSVKMGREILNGFDELEESNNRLELPLIEYRAIVGYLGTIEMPKQIATSSKLQTVRSCIRKLRQEKRSPTTVLMTILPACLTLKSHNNCILAEYPASRLSYVSSSSESDHRFFGLVTSATYADGLVCDLENKNVNRTFFGVRNINVKSLEEKINSVKTDIDVAISNSCHVFMIDTKITEHNFHCEKAETFKIICTKDPISNTCLEFPTNSEYIVNIIRSMYSLKLPNVKLDIGNISEIKPKRNQMDPRFNLRVEDPRLNIRVEGNRNFNAVNNENELLPHINEFVANSPQPSNHSEITTTSSNSDSGIGFHNDCTNISDRILVVDFPNQLNARQQPTNRPLAINGEIFEENNRNDLNQFPERQQSDSVRNIRSQAPVPQLLDIKIQDDKTKEESRLTVRAMPDPVKIPRSDVYEVENIDTQNYESIYSVEQEMKTVDNNGKIVSERPIDVPENDFYSFESENIRNSIALLARSCDNMNLLSKNETKLSIDDISMYSSKSSEPFTSKTKKSFKFQSSIDDVSLFGSRKKQKSDFLHPDDTVITKSSKSQKRKKPSTFKEKNVEDLTVVKQMNPDVLLNYKLSPQVFGLSRPSVSFENLCQSGSKTKDKCVGDLWGSLQELRGRKELNYAPLEGTLSEPDLRAKPSCLHSETQPVSSPFRRWGSSSSSLKSRGGRVHSQRHPRRPNSLAASDHDMYTKCGDGDDQSTCESETQGSGSGRGGVASWSAAFERLLEDTSGLHTFAEFLKKEFSAENIYFWTACERYRFLTNPTERAKEAQSIFTRHLGSAATEPVNVDSPARQLAQDNLHAAEKDLFLQAQKQIFNLMKFDSYPRFLRSDLHKLCVEAEAAKKPLPFPGDKLDECLKTRATLSTPSKLKKSASNAEDKRRKSLLPWHRKARCKSKDRGEQEYNGNQQAGIKGAAAQGGLSVSKSLDVHSSRSSLASWDAALSGQSVTSSGPTTEEASNSTKSTLCRVFLSDGATTVMQTKPQDTVKQLIEKLLDKRGLTYLAYEVYIAGTNNKSVDAQESSTVLAGREVIVEQRVSFKLDLPNRKVISVRSKVTKILGEVLRPILHKYNYRLDLVQVLLNPDSTENLDMSLSILAVDGHRLSIQCKPAEGWKGEVTQISTTNPLAVTAKIRNGTQGTVPVPSLDEITNRVFEDILQVKAESHNQPEKISDQSSVKSEDYGSETSSGIFGRFLRRDSNAPPRTHRTKKLGIAPVPASIIPKPVTGSTEEISEASHKPLIAKWKAGVKLQMTGRSESDELVEGLNRAQRARLEDQRGTEINFELPDFLKDKENYQGVAKLRKLKRNVESQPILPSEACQRICDENLNITHVSHSNLPTPSIRISPGITKPNPAPRLSIGQTQSPNKHNPTKETVQTKVNELEKNLGKLNLNNSLQSPIKSGFNSLETTVIENCVADSTIICNQIDNLNQSFSSCDSKHDDRVIKHDRNNSTSSSDIFNNDILNSSFKSTSSENDRQKNCSDPPPLPPKPKILPIKPSNWGHNLNTNDNVFNLSQERMRSPKISASSDNLVARSAYLDQPSSSFV